MDFNLISKGFCCPTLLDDLVVPSDLMQYTFLVEFLWSYYEILLRNSIGLRMQKKLNKEQALSVSACKSTHENISLFF